jgi:hypothetical protein
MLQVLVIISLESFLICKKEACGYVKRIVLKNRQVFEISKTMGTHMPTMKKRKKRRK